MRKLYKSIKLTSLLTLFIAFNVAAGPVAVVNSVRGGVFGTLNGKTKQLRPGDHLEDFSEVFTEVGAQVILSDYYDHKYHLAGSGHVRFLNKTVELKGGYLWVQSFQDTYDFMVQTANAQSTFKKGEAIISFDAYKGKSQILVIKGSFSFGNILEQYLKTEVEEGHFSFLHKDYENGSPRNPTPIGFNSFKKVTSLFQDVELKEEKKTHRTIASEKSPAPVYHRPAYGKKVAVSDKPVMHRSVYGKKEYHPTSRQVASTKDFDIIDMAKGRTPQSVLPSQPSEYQPSVNDQSVNQKDGIIYLIEDKEKKVERRRDLASYYENKLKVMRTPKKKKFRPDYSQKSGVQVNVFGSGPKRKLKKINTFRNPSSVTKPKKVKKTKVRAPASIGGMVPKIKSKGAFEGSLIDQYKKQVRHSNEVNSLIDALESYDQDYSKSY